MGKNIIFLPAIDIPEMRKTRKDYDPDVFQIGVQAFRKWAADKPDVEIMVMEDLVHPLTHMSICPQRYYCHQMLEAQNIDYDQILISDTDCIIHPDCPNFFEMTDGKYTVVRTQGSFDWICRSMENWGDVAFDGARFPPHRYFNGGFQIFGKKHRWLHEKFLEMFDGDNAKILLDAQNRMGVGTDQGIINHIVHANLNEDEIKYLNYEFSMIDLPRANLLDEEMTFTKYPGIFQFNCLPSKDGRALMGDVGYWMRKTYLYFYPNG